MIIFVMWNFLELQIADCPHLAIFVHMSKRVQNSTRLLLFHNIIIDYVMISSKNSTKVIVYMGYKSEGNPQSRSRPFSVTLQIELTQLKIAEYRNNGQFCFSYPALDRTTGVWP